MEFSSDVKQHLCMNVWLYVWLRKEKKKKSNAKNVPAWSNPFVDQANAVKNGVTGYITLYNQN